MDDDRPEQSSATAKTVAASASEERAEGVVRLLNGGLEIAGVDEGDGGHEDHGGVDEPCAVHGDEDVDELVVQEAAEDGAARQLGGLVAHFEVLQRLAGGEGGAGELFEARLHQRGVEIDDVRHDGCAQHGDGGVDAVVEVLRGGAVERGQQGVDGGELPVRMDEEDLECVGDADDGDEAHDAALQPAEPGEVEREDGEDQDGGDERSRKQGFLGGEAAGVEQGAEEQVEADGRAEEFGEIGGDCGDFGGDPEAEGRGPGEILAAVLGQGEAGDDAQLGGEILDEHGHGVGPEQHPEQAIAKLRAAQDIGGEVAGIDVGDGGDECRAEVGPHRVAMETWADGIGAAPDGWSREEAASGGVRYFQRGAARAFDWREISHSAPWRFEPTSEDRYRYDGHCG